MGRSGDRAEAPDRAVPSWYRTALWSLLVLFSLRVAGQAVVAAFDVGFLPPRRIRLAALAGYVVYVALALLVTQAFLLAVFFHVPAALFLLGVLAARFARSRERWTLVAALGVSLTFVASAVQQSGIAVHPSYFNHNALYHLIQAVALWLIFLGFRANVPG
ncbi:MAG: DUF6962 family protein [Gemmatimonadales bacterium]